MTTDCGCTLVVKCHNKGSCIQGPVEKLSWLHTNFITKQRIYLIQCYNDQSQFSFLCRYIWEIFNNHFRLLLQREAGYFDTDHVVRLSTLIYWNLFYCKSWTDQEWKWCQLNFQKFSNPVQLAAFIQQLCTILKRSWSKKLLNSLKVFEKYWIPLLGLQKSLKFNTLSTPHCFLWN